jgi:hypothetical protein
MEGLSSGKSTQQRAEATAVAGEAEAVCGNLTRGSDAEPDPTGE